MKIIKGNQIPDGDAFKQTTGYLITGQGPATIKMVLGKQDGDVKFSLAKTHWYNGARNIMHTHTEDQLVIVTGGKGVVSLGKEETIVSEGDIVYIPAGEKHYHGAATDSEFHSYSLTLVGSKTEGCK